MGGFDLRWSLPWVPVALYAQAIGEDEAGLLAEQVPRTCRRRSSGAASVSDPGARTSNTPTPPAISQKSEPTFGCAYRNSIYSDGYQYRDRSIGHALDGDSEQVAAGMMLVERATAAAGSWRPRARRSIARAPIPCTPWRCSRLESAPPTCIIGGPCWAGSSSLAIGYEERESASAGLDEGDVRGLVQWRREYK